MLCAWKECPNDASTKDFRLTNCAGCRRAKYCCVACQKAHWPEHKSFCKTVQAFAKLCSKDTISASRVAKLTNNDAFRSRENFEIMITTPHLDLLSLMKEDLITFEGSFGSSSSSAPVMCWTYQLLCTQFRGMPSASGDPGSFAGVHSEYFVRFLNRERESGVQCEPWYCLMQVITQILTISAKDPNVREYIGKPLLRAVTNVLASVVIMNVVLASEECVNCTANAFHTNLYLVRDLDAKGLDPNGAMEGLVYQTIALVDLHLQRISKARAKAYFAKIAMSKSDITLYNMMAVGMAKTEITKQTNVDRQLGRGV
jgi:hypothetical protein